MMGRVAEIEEALRALPRSPLIEQVAKTRELSSLSESLRAVNPASRGVYLKDDSQISPVYGGNKVRKLEFILGEAIERRERELWTIGGLGSHHVLATALYCQRLGIKCRVFHVHQPLTTQALTTLKALVSAEPVLHLMSPPIEGERLAHAVRRQLSAWLEEGESELGGSPYFVPSGGSNRLGTIGYLLAAFELVREIDEGRLPMIDRIYIAAGSGSTLAGLALGLSIVQSPIEVIGVRVVSKSLVNERGVHRLIVDTVKLIESYGLNLGGWENSIHYRILKGHLGQGYGLETKRGQEAMIQAADDQLTLDHIYTAKAMGALIEESSLRAGRSLFWHTLNTSDQSIYLTRAEALGGLSSLPTAYLELLKKTHTQ